MSEIWNSNSIIEEKHSISSTPQLNQFKVYFNIRDFDGVLKKLYNKQNIDESDFTIIMYFINNDLKDKYKERYEALVQYASEELKKAYTIDKLKQLRINLDDDFINGLYNGNFTFSQKEIAYSLLSENNSFLTDRLIDERVKKNLKNNITEEFMAEKIKNYINSEKHNPLSKKELMNTNLKNEIINSIPSDYTKLEQCIYVYIRLCQILSYDSSYYVNNKEFIQFHESLANLEKISRENPNIVCYEFVTLYSELLEKIGIKSNVNTQFYMGVDENDKLVVDSFRDNHASLEFNVDCFIISADSTNSVLNGDLINAKLGNKLNGLKCKNISEVDKLIFSSSLEKVYNNIAKNNNFKNYNDKIVELPLTERLQQLFNDILKMNVQGVDFISYINNLKHKYFSQDELQWNISINYVGKNDGIDQYPVVIFSINTNDIINAQQDTTQYLYDTKTHELTKFDNQELKELFDSELFYLEETKNIPGISNIKAK